MRINYSVFDSQTSSSEDLYCFAFLHNPLSTLLKHYDSRVRKKSRKLKQLGVKKARIRVKKYYYRLWN